MSRTGSGKDAGWQQSAHSRQDLRRRRGGAERQGEKGLRWAIYLRNSKKRKNANGEVSSVSQATQEERCRQGIVERDPTPVSVTVFREEGRSGGGGRRRPVRDELVEAVAAGEFDAVMAFHAQRVGRNLFESAALWEHLAAHGVELHCTNQSDLHSPIIRGVLFGQAEQEYNDRRDYAHGAIAYRRAQGLVGMKTGWPYGLRWDREELVAIPVQLKWVKWIYSRYRDGWTMGRIASALTAKGIARQRGSRVWDANPVSDILNSTWYVGRVPDGVDDAGHTIYWNAGRQFIDDDLDRAVKEALPDRSRGGTKNQVHALRGLVFCGVCEGWSPMSLCWSEKPRKHGGSCERPRYRCIHHQYDPAFCPESNSTDSARTEAVLLDVIRAEIGTTELSQVRFAAARRFEVGALEEDIAKWTAKQAAAEAAQDNLYARRDNGEVIPERIYNREMKRHQLDAQTAEEEAGRLRQRTVLDPRRLENLRRHLAISPLDETTWFTLPEIRRNEFLRLIFPFGVFIHPRPNGSKRGSVEGRVGPRTEDDHQGARVRRALAIADPGHRVEQSGAA